VDELHPTRPQTGEEPVEFVRRVHPDIIYRVAYLSEAAHEEGPPVAEERYMVASTKQGGMMDPLLDPPPVPVGRDDGLGASVPFEEGGRDTPPKHLILALPDPDEPPEVPPEVNPPHSEVDMFTDERIDPLQPVSANVVLTTMGAPLGEQEYALVPEHVNSWTFFVVKL
jgi:hypothetical protein